jgi:hypothetical protein
MRRDELCEDQVVYVEYQYLDYMIPGVIDELVVIEEASKLGYVRLRSNTNGATTRVHTNRCYTDLDQLKRDVITESMVNIMDQVKYIRLLEGVKF